MARLLGKPLMPWQQYVADVILEIDPATGRFAYSEWGLTVPRQSGKSTFLLAKAVHRASATQFFGRSQHIVYTAQTRKDARKKFDEDYAGVLDASPSFRHKADCRWGNGNEHIRFPNGSRFGIEANTEKAGHGGTLDEAYIDEAFSQVDGRMEQAFGPAMITRANTQLAWISTAGWLDGSPFLQTKMKRGRVAAGSGQTSGLAYFEWSAHEDDDPADPDIWATCMPALGHTIPLAAIQARYAAAVDEGKLHDFRRAYLNQWVMRQADDESTIPPNAWSGCRDTGSVFGDVATLAVDVAPDRSVTNIGGVGLRADGKQHVELLAQLPGTHTAVAELGRLLAKRPGRPMIDPSGAAGSLLPDLDKAGIEYELVNAQDISQACGAFYDAVVANTLAHIDQEPLTAAVLGATNKTMSRGGWKWFPMGEASISPLWAVTLASYGHAKHGTTTPFVPLVAWR